MTNTRNIRRWLHQFRWTMFHVGMRHPLFSYLALLSLLITVLACGIIGSFLYQQALDRFRTDVEHSREALDQQVAMYQSVLASAASTDQDARTDYPYWKSIAQGLLSQDKFTGLDGVFLTDSIDASKVSAYEEQIRYDLNLPAPYKRFRVTSALSTGTLAIIRAFEPMEQSEAWLGFDLNSNDDLRAALVALQTSDAIDVSLAEDLPGQKGRNSILLSTPMIASSSEVSDENSTALPGFIHLLLNTRRIIQALPHDQHLNLRFVSLNDNRHDIEESQQLQGDHSTDPLLFERFHFRATFNSFIDDKVLRVEAQAPLLSLVHAGDWIGSAAFLLTLVVWNTLSLTAFMYVAGKKAIHDRFTRIIARNLRKREEHLRALTESAPLGLVVLTERGSVSYWNKFFQEMSGLTSAQIKSGEWFKEFWSERKEGIDAHADLEIASNDREGIAFKLRHPVNGEVWSRVKISAIREGKKIQAHLCTFLDISVEKMLEEEIAASGRQFKGVRSSELGTSKNGNDARSSQSRSATVAPSERDSLNTDHHANRPVIEAQEAESLPLSPTKDEIIQAMMKTLETMLSGETVTSRTSSPPSSPPAVQSPLTQSPRALVIEQLRANQVVIQRYLNEAGIEAVVVDNEASALAMARQEAFNYIFVEFDLPSMSGERMIRTLHKEGNQVPVIAISSRKEINTPEFLKRIGCQSALIKPFSEEDTIRALYNAGDGERDKHKK